MLGLDAVQVQAAKAVAQNLRQGLGHDAPVPVGPGEGIAHLRRGVVPLNPHKADGADDPARLLPFDAPAGGLAHAVLAQHIANVAAGLGQAGLGLPEHISGHLRILAVIENVLSVAHVQLAQAQAGRFQRGHVAIESFHRGCLRIRGSFWPCTGRSESSHRGFRPASPCPGPLRRAF